MAYINTKRVERMLKLDKTVITEIKDDKNAMQEAFVTMMAATIIGSIWQILTSLGFALIAIIIGTPIAWFIGTGICHIIAKALGGKGNFNDYLKLSAYTEAPAFLGIIPILGTFVGGILSLIMFVRATKEVHSLTTGKAILVILIPAIVLFALIMVGVILFGLSMASMAGSGY